MFVFRSESCPFEARNGGTSSVSSENSAYIKRYDVCLKTLQLEHYFKAFDPFVHSVKIYHFISLNNPYTLTKMHYIVNVATENLDIGKSSLLCMLGMTEKKGHSDAVYTLSVIILLFNQVMMKC